MWHPKYRFKRYLSLKDGRIDKKLVDMSNSFQLNSIRYLKNRYVSFKVGVKDKEFIANFSNGLVNIKSTKSSRW